MPRTAADTNLIIRLIAHDDSDQLEKVEKLLGAGGLILDTTVVVEIEWVLRGPLRFDRAGIQAAMAGLLALPTIIFTEPDRVAKAIEWHADGMDFADALHLAGASECDEFVTFDRDFARRAESLDSEVPVRLL